MSKKTLVNYGLIVLALLLPSLSFAASSSTPFEIPDGDKFKSIFLDTLFGPLVGNDAAGSNPLGPIIGEFCSAVMMIAGLVTAYTMMAGTLATAHEGEVLGKRWSSVWIPLRLSLGASVLMPLPSGYCVMQVCVMWLAMQGIGLADKIWATFLTNPVDNAAYVMPDMSSQVRQIAGRMLELQACRYGYEQEGQLDQDHGGYGEALFGIYTEDVAPTPTDSGQGMSYGPCGSTYQLTSAQIAENAGIDLSNTGRALTNARQVAAGLWPVHAQQLKLMATDAEALAKKLGPNSQADVNAYLSNVSARYSNAMNTALQGANQAALNQDIRDDMAKDGFLFAGSYYLQITTAQDQITQAVSAFPTVSVGSDAAQGLHGDAVHALNYASTFVENAQKAAQTGLGADSDANSGLMAKVLTWFTQGKGLDMQSDATLNTNPIIRAKNLGNSMITYGWSVLGVGLGSGGIAGIAAGNIGGKIVGADTAFLGGVTIISPFVFALAFSLISTGYGLAGYLPMVPYVIWMASMIGYCILLIEAIFAAPLWAFTHIVPDGDGVVGRGGQGYMLVLSLMIRPALMVMGMVASIVLMKPIGYVITSTFAAAYNLAVIQHSGWGGLTITIGGCILYFVILTATIHRIFSLIHSIPDSIMRWLGGGSHSELGDHSTKMEGHAHHQNAAALGAMTGVGSSIAAVGSNLERGMDKRDNQNRKRQDQAWQQQQASLDALNDKKSRGDGEDRDPNKKPIPGDKPDNDKPGPGGPGKGQSKNATDSGNVSETVAGVKDSTSSPAQNETQSSGDAANPVDKQVQDEASKDANPKTSESGQAGNEGGQGMEPPTSYTAKAQAMDAPATSPNPSVSRERPVRDPSPESGIQAHQEGVGAVSSAVGQGGPEALSKADDKPVFDKSVTTPLPPPDVQTPGASTTLDTQPALPGIEQRGEELRGLPVDGLRPMPEKKPRGDSDA